MCIHSGRGASHKANPQNCEQVNSSCANPLDVEVICRNAQIMATNLTQRVYTAIEKGEVGLKALSWKRAWRSCKNSESDTILFVENDKINRRTAACWPSMKISGQDVNQGIHRNYLQRAGSWLTLPLHNACNA